MAGVKGMTVYAFDEALGLPTAEAVTLSLRTSQILAEESGVPHVSDPLGGSFYVESLTGQVEHACMKLIGQIDDQGGLISCIESGWVKSEVQAAANAWREEVEEGTRPIVGLNRFAVAEAPDIPVFEPDPEVARLALDDLEAHKRSRDERRARLSLDALTKAAKTVRDGNDVGAVMGALIDAAHADATLGEMQTVLFEVFGFNK
jgi:methylmalonyl-CoA mutase N-terminal domain/subunit